eukprot:g2758.t1
MLLDDSFVSETLEKYEGKKKKGKGSDSSSDSSSSSDSDSDEEDASAKTYANATIIKVRVYEKGEKRLVLYDVVYEVSGEKEKKVERDRIRISATSPQAKAIFEKEQEDLERMKAEIAEKQKAARAEEEVDETEEVEAWCESDDPSEPGQWAPAIVLEVRHKLGAETKYDVLFMATQTKKKKLPRNQIRSAAQLEHGDFEEQLDSDDELAAALGGF